MKSLAIRLAALLLPAIVVLGARQSHAETWCGDGPGSSLNHPCIDEDDTDDDPVVSAAIAKYQDKWMELDGVWMVEPGGAYHNVAPNIEVHVVPASVAAAKEKIPSSVDGISVVIVPGDMPHGLPAASFGYLADDPTESARLAKQREDRAKVEEERAKAEESYDSIVKEYNDHWMALPGVVGIDSGKCEPDGCDFKQVEVTVQRELLPEVRKEIPDSIDGVPIVLTPDD